MSKYQLPEGITDLEIHHISIYDKLADLPLKIYNDDKSKAALIPTFKNIMIVAFPHFFKNFDKNRNSNTVFAEANHQDGEIYEITVPKLKDPKNVAGFFRCALQTLGAELDTVKPEDLIEYFWSAMYFQHDQMIEKLFERATKKFDLGILGVLAYHDKIKDENLEIIKKTIESARNLNLDVYKIFDYIDFDLPSLMEFVKKYGTVLGMDLQFSILGNIGRR